jgi:hypothetical protein
VPYAVDRSLGIVAAAHIVSTPHDPLKEIRASALAGWVVMVRPRYAQLDQVAASLIDIQRSGLVG